MNHSSIIGTGSYLPKKVLTNEDLSKIIETSDEWIVTRTGIRERRVVSEGETNSDMAVAASKEALNSAGIIPSDLNMIICATQTGDQRLPSASFLLQDKLGAKKAAVFDIAVACSGFVYALSVADQFIKTGMMEHILVVGVEVMSKVVNWKDRSTCVLFGDGAGAVVLSRSKTKKRELLSTHLYSNGSLHYLLDIKGGGTATEWTPESLERGDHLVHMEGKEVFREAVQSMSQAAKVALEANGVSLSDISLFIPHQANDRIIKAVAKKLSLPLEKIFINLDTYGNMSAATIPVALDEAVRQKRISEGDLVLLTTFGAGFAWGSALIRW